MDTYCWIHSTFSIPERCVGKPEEAMNFEPIFVMLVLVVKKKGHRLDARCHRADNS